jgi:hypothetical protein
VAAGRLKLGDGVACYLRHLQIGANERTIKIKREETERLPVVYIKVLLHLCSYLRTLPTQPAEREPFRAPALR